MRMLGVRLEPTCGSATIVFVRELATAFGDINALLDYGGINTANPRAARLLVESRHATRPCSQRTLCNHALSI